MRLCFSLDVEHREDEIGDSSKNEVWNSHGVLHPLSLCVYCICVYCINVCTIYDMFSMVHYIVFFSPQYAVCSEEVSSCMITKPVTKQFF